MAFLDKTGLEHLITTINDKYAPKTGSGASGTWSISVTGNAGTATKATQDSAGQQINTTYIKGLSVSGKTITYTKGNGTTGTITTQDTDTTYSAGTGISLSGTTFSNAGVRSIATGTSNGTISVNTNGTSANVAVYGLGSAAYTSSDAYYTSGTSRTKNTVLAAPNGSNGAATFRALVAADIPSLDAGKITSGTLPVTRGGTGATDAANARTNLGAASLDGNTFNGPQVLNCVNINQTTAPSATAYSDAFQLKDKNGTRTGEVRLVQAATSGIIGTELGAIRTVSGTNYYNAIAVELSSTGAASYRVAYPSKFRQTIEAPKVYYGTSAPTSTSGYNTRDLWFVY